MFEEYMLSLRGIPPQDRVLRVLVDILMEIRKYNSPGVKVNKPLDKK